MKKPAYAILVMLTRFYLASLAIVPMMLGLHCSSEPERDIKKAIPNLVIIGEDLSGTFAEFPATTEEDLRNLCNAVSHSKGGGKVYFIGIGSTTPKGYAYCVIRPNRIINLNDPPHKIKNDKVYNVRIKQANEQAINQFIANAAVIFQQRNQKYTDINGFFVKVGSIVQTPNHKRFKKWLYVNSDGKQATSTSSKVDCSLLPDFDEFYVNRGWRKGPDCNPAAKLPDTPHFIDYFQSTLMPADTASQME